MMRIFAKIIFRIARSWEHFRRGLRARYYAALFKECARPLPKIGKNVTISHPQYIKCGGGCIFNQEIFLDGKGGIELGNNVWIASGSKILTGSLQLGEPYVFEHKHKRLPVKIGNNVAIFTNAIITQGVTIEDYVIVAAGSVVTKDLKSGWIYGGIPAKPIRPIWPDCPEKPAEISGERKDS